jgi:hypothetical protein
MQPILLLREALAHIRKQSMPRQNHMLSYIVRQHSDDDLNSQKYVAILYDSGDWKATASRWHAVSRLFSSIDN